MQNTVDDKRWGISMRKMRQGDLAKVYSKELKMIARKTCKRCNGTGYAGTLIDPHAKTKSKLICSCVQVVEADKEKLAESQAM